MGNLSCVSCQNRKVADSKNSGQAPSPPTATHYLQRHKDADESERNTTDAAAAVAAADVAVDHDLVEIQKPHEEQEERSIDVPLTASRSALTTTATDTNNVEVASSDEIVIADRSETADDRHTRDERNLLLDWWCRSRDGSRDAHAGQSVALSNDDTPSIEVIASAIVQLTLYLASQVVCPAIERHLADKLRENETDKVVQLC